MQTSPKLLSGEEAYTKYLDLKSKGLILFESIVGSQAYGTASPESDIDKKFIFIDTLESLLTDDKVSQLTITDDYVGYELGRYFELLSKQSPNMHELIWSPEDCIEYCHPLFKEIILNQRHRFLSKEIKFSFGEYANSQIKKARGLNKKIVNPFEKKRKSVLDFCYVPYNQGSIKVEDWLKEKGLKQEYCGLVAIDHMHYTYHLFYNFPSHAQNIKYYESDVDEDIADSITFCTLACDYYHWDCLTSAFKYYEKIKTYDNLKYKGIIQSDDSNTVSLSSVEKNIKPLCTLYFNLEGYMKYCKDYKEYWEWVERRNETRYQTNISHGAEYDSKNMSHCHRLLDTCIEALRDNVINVRRQNREELLKIKSGHYAYDQLLLDAENKIKIISELYESTTLPNEIDEEFLREILLKFRKSFYFLK